MALLSWLSLRGSWEITCWLSAEKREKYEVDTKSHLIYDRHENGVMFQINTLGPRPAMGRKGRKYD